MDNNLIGKIVMVETGEVGKVIDIHRKGLHYDDNLKEEFYYLVQLPEIGSNLYFSSIEFKVINFK